MTEEAMSELHLYDFDGTLFRSPYEPVVWKGDWWNDVRSLMPPCVPENPGTDWWIQDTLSSARASIRDPDVYAILATGRPAQSGLRYRVPELLRTQSLAFDEVHLAPPSGTLSWKKRVLYQTIQKFEFDTVRIWDDRISHLGEFKTIVQRAGIAPENIHLTHVRARSKEPECGETMEVEKDLTRVVSPRFFGLFLDAKSRAALAHAFPYAHQKLLAEHVTVLFKPKMTDDLIAMIGTPGRARVTGYVEDENGQAVTVEFLDGLRRLDNYQPHVTLSLVETKEAVYSNEMIARGPIQEAPPIILTGILDVSPRSLSPARVVDQYLAAR